MNNGANLVNSGVDGAAKAGQGVYNVGNTIQNAPVTAMDNYNRIMNPVLNSTGTGTNTIPGSQVAGAAGGAIVGNQIAQQVSNNLGFNNPPVVDGGYSTGQGDAYGGYIDANGNFIPYRRGM
jgi:hypothetical protein